jgi:xanthine/CO dehydrogenase XdhC/CoxF family maturation factor
MVKDPVEDIHRLAAQLRAEHRPFSIATVIEVEGSASALTGSKAIFDETGINLLGWVGGGCAERYVGEQSAEALQAGQTRIVLADLDDEIFGLGVACGGKMRIFIEPVPKPETVRVSSGGEFQRPMEALAKFYGWNLQIDAALAAPQTMRDLLFTMASAIATTRKTSFKPLRETKDLPVLWLEPKERFVHQVTLVGTSRITEALTRHFELLQFDVRNVAGRDEFEFRAGEVVIVASHTSNDRKIVEKAMQMCQHVAMVGSRKRALEVLGHLAIENETALPLYIPAGLDIEARNPDEIALSIVAEIIQREQKWI